MNITISQARQLPHVTVDSWRMVSEDKKVPTNYDEDKRRLMAENFAVGDILVARGLEVGVDEEVSKDEAIELMQRVANVVTGGMTMDLSYSSWELKGGKHELVLDS